MKVYLLLVLAIVGCATQVDTPVDEVPTKVEPTGVGVTRVIEPATVTAGAQATVKMYVNLGEGQTYYLFEEGVPAEFVVLDGQPDAKNKLKHIKIQDAVSTVITYRVTAPSAPGTYTFEGEYAVEGMKDPAPIMGDTAIIVQ